ncbi:MAG: M48 family metalloprotease [Candidatus Aminicenantales bacterium]
MIKPKANFWELQAREKRITIFLFFILLLFYFLTVAAFSFTLLFSLGLLIPGFIFFTGSSLVKYLLANLLTSLGFTFYNFFHARKAGPSYILNRLRAYCADPSDRYHQMFINVVEEMRIASGSDEVRSYILPTASLNTLSLVTAAKKPAIVVTEGLLNEASRDELQASVAHEIAHLTRGDTYMLTLVCSLASFYEELLASLQKEGEADFDAPSFQDSRRLPGHPLLYLVGLLSFTLMKVLTTAVSRQREFLADAKAVELVRDPLPLARIIYKAHRANSCLGEASLFTPLFLVPPDSRDISENFWSRLFNTHPPLVSRLKRLTSMVGKSPGELLVDIREREKQREAARLKMKSTEELTGGETALAMNLFPRSVSYYHPKEDWLVKKTGGGWEGPYSLSALLSLAGFSPGTRIKNIQDGREGKAGDFFEVRQAYHRLQQARTVDSRFQDKCPACQADLHGAFYEGVRIKVCPLCGSKLVAEEDMEKILTRQEIGFSPALMAKAEQWRKKILSPGSRKWEEAASPLLYCPRCGLKMNLRPYSYHYTLPVGQCFNCGLLWLPGDTLEILQALVEEKKEMDDI